MRINGAQSVDRALGLLLRVVDDEGNQSLATLGRELGLAPATCYRLASSLRRAGMISAVGNGRFAVGPALFARQERLSPRPALVSAARPILRNLAQQTGCAAHVGVLESDMVTYLVREGAADAAIHSKEGKQLEAYCSGIGKMLLASLTTDAQDAYLASAPFVALTERTITDPFLLRAELTAITEQGFARDVGESSPDIHCLAMAIRAPNGRAIAAISLSLADAKLDERRILKLLGDGRAQLESELFGKRL